MPNPVQPAGAINLNDFNGDGHSDMPAVRLHRQRRQRTAGRKEEKQDGIDRQQYAERRCERSKHQRQRARHRDYKRAHRRCRFPRVVTRLVQITIEEELRALHEESIDVGLIRGPIGAADCESVEQVREPLVALVPASHPFAQRSALTLAEMVTEPIVAIEITSVGSFSRLILTALERDGFIPRYRELESDTHALIALVAAGVGIALIPQSIQCLSMRNVRFVPIADPTPDCTIELIWRSDTNSFAARSFIAHVCATHGKARQDL